MSEPKSLRALLAGWRPAGERTAPGSEAGALAAAWAEAVGADVARRTRTSTFRDGSLAVITPSSAWSHQLTFLAPTIIERLRERCPGIDVRRLRFMVATGRSRALLAGTSHPEVARSRSMNEVPRSRSRAQAQEQTRDQDRGTTSMEGEVDGGPIEGDDVDAWLGRLRREQTRLDSQRQQAGWLRCDSCGRWFDDAVPRSRSINEVPRSRSRVVVPERSPGLRRCALCAEEARRAADGRIAHALAGAPWLSRTELTGQLRDADARGYERVRSTLLTLWDQQLYNARRRLRRDALEAADRVLAWSYVMMVTQRPQAKIGAAMLADVLGREWADALFGRERKAPRPAREKSTR